MSRLGWLTLGLALWVSATAAMAAEAPPREYGAGAAYDALGRLAVLHSGRVKPLDTLAREEIKQIFGRETIRLIDPTRDNKTVATWTAVAALFDWSVRPEFWDEQPIILAEYLPLKRLILASSIEARLSALAEKAGLSEADRAGIKALTEDKELDAKTIRAFVAKSTLPGTEKAPGEERRILLTLASELSEDHKWLSPKQLSEAKIAGESGAPVDFEGWFRSVVSKRSGSMGGADGPTLTEVEKRGDEVGRRLVHYKAIRDRSPRSVEPMLVMPRPSNKAYLAFLTQTYEKAQKEGPRGLTTFELDGAVALDKYWNELPRDERELPGENAEFDKEFQAWLAGSSAWVPLSVFLDTDAKILSEAGFPADKLEQFVARFKELDRAEEAAPGEVDVVAVKAFVKASRALGESVGSPQYPSVAAIDREVYFNRTNPFYKAPVYYAAALVILAITLGFTGVERNSLVRLGGRSLYVVGILALGAGVAMEVVGFYYRVLISGWAPVTNMYETVIWVSLVAAVLGLVFEAIFRRAYVGLAASGVALLGTLLAANVPLLDPNIKQLQPVLRSNYWLTIHVITEVSSYGAFLLAAFLGLIATLFYLTATYRRTPSYGRVSLPIVLGMPVLVLGALGVLACDGRFGEAWVMSKPLYLTVSTLACVGGMIAFAGVLAVVGEVVSRLLFREDETAVTIVASSESAREFAAMASGHGVGAAEAGGVATLTKPTIAEIRASTVASLNRGDSRTRAMQATAAQIKPLSNFIYRTMQVGVLLIAAGTILGGVWADYSWGRFWGWDPKEVWALITLLVYLIPLHGRFAGWINTFALVASSVFCSMSVIMAWYGVNFVLGVGLHSYGFVEGGGQLSVFAALCGVLAFPIAAGWRRHLGSIPVAA